MGRSGRFVDADGYAHVWSRGNFQQNVFRDGYERLVFDLRLGDVAVEHQWVVMAWCQMTNHVHFVLQAEQQSLSDGMRLLLGGFSAWSNRRAKRRGHLFENRFSMRQLEDDADLMGTCRYVVLNPVEAGICAHPGDWRWSSYRVTAGLDFAPPWLALDRLMPFFGPTPAAARAAYRRFVRDALAQVSDTGAEV